MIETKFVGKLNSPVGILKIISDKERLLKIEFTSNGFAENNNDITKKTKIQLLEYFDRKRKKFQLPVQIQENNFNGNIWRLLLTIPYGTTVSYKQLAEMAGNPEACRAVGNANNKNILPIIIPCHRVIKSDGNLGGYSAGTYIKKYLINLEKE